MRARSLSVAECRQRLRDKRVGRVVFTDRALPSAVPVNYMLVDDAIVFRTDPGGLLARLLDGVGDAVLGFEVDDVDESCESGWSVLAIGLAARVSGEDARRISRAGLRSWGSESANTFVRIPIARLTGRTVEPAPA